MRQLSHLLSLLFLFVYQSSKSQTFIQRDKVVDPVLKQVDAKFPGLKIFGRKDGKGGYVNMAVLVESKRQLKWFSCYGVVFDSAQLGDDEYRQVFAGSLDPFTFYRNYCYQNLSYIEHAETQYRLQGEAALQDTSHNNQVVFNAGPVRSAHSTLQKLMAIEGLMKRISLQLQLFDCKSPLQLHKGRNDSHTPSGFTGSMISRNDNIEYYNIDPLSSVSKIVLHSHSCDKFFVYNNEEVLIDSVPLKPNKYASLLRGKEDMFLLYRGWLELRWQQAADAKRQYAGLLCKVDSGLYRPTALDPHDQQLQNLAQTLHELEISIDEKISNLLIPNVKLVEQLIADFYNAETSEISYLPGLGFAYTTSYIRGKKTYELTDHRRNIMAVISDKKKAVDEDSDEIVEYYNADIVNLSDYYPFGMQQPGREYTIGDKYRYGYNGKENDNEIKGDGNQIDYGMRVYDPRIGRFLSVDPLQKQYPELTPYQFTANSPIENVDLDGKEVYNYRLDLDDKGHRTGFKYLGKNVGGIFGWTVWNIFGIKIPAVDVYQNGKIIGSYSFNSVGQGGLQTLKEFANNEKFRNEYMRSELTDGQKQTKHAEEIGNTFAQGFQTAATVNYAMSRAQTAPQSKVDNNTPGQQTNKQATAAQGGNSNAAKVNQGAAEDKWKNFDFEEYKTVYHKGSLDGGRVSSDRPLSTGTDPGNVNAIRGGTLYEFKIPKTVYNQWYRNGFVQEFKDLDIKTGVINEEIRFDKSLSDQLNKYMTNDKKPK